MEESRLINILKFSLKDIYNYIGYTFKSDILCVSAFKDYKCKEIDFRDKEDKKKIYHIENDNRVLANYGDMAIYGTLGNLIGEQTYLKGSGSEYIFNYKIGELTKIKVKLSENSTFDKAIKRIGFDKFIIKGKELHEKAFANIFEALVGAVAIDSSWDYQLITNVYKKLIGNYKGFIPPKSTKQKDNSKLKEKEKTSIQTRSLDYYASLFEKISKEDCLEKINNLVNTKKISKPKVEELPKESNSFVIKYSIKEIGTEIGKGKKKQDAKREACYKLICGFLKMGSCIHMLINL